MSKYFMPIDLANIAKDSVKVNFTGHYNPDKFWEDMGKYYLNSFSQGEKSLGENLMLNINQILIRINDLKPKSILEIGCGFGRCLAYIVANVPNLERLEGIELSSTMIEQSKLYFDRVEDIDADRIKITQANAAKLPFKDNEFDLIFSHVCLTHIPCESIPAVTSEISRVAKNHIIHLERFKFPYEHSLQHGWSHMLAPYYMDLDWYMHENAIINETHNTNSLVLINKKVR